MLSLLWFILILGSIVAIHEFGHFIFAKFANIYVYEFSIGMGKKIFGRKKKGKETEFCVRAIPLGGYVMIAGEDTLDDKIPADRQMCNKSFLQRFMVLFAGPFNNFWFAFVILFISALIFGAIPMKPEVREVTENYPAYNVGIQTGDLILKVNGKKVRNYDKAILMLQLNGDKEVTLNVKKATGEVVDYKIQPILVTDENGETGYKIGIKLGMLSDEEREFGFLKSVKYAFNRTVSLFSSMFDTLKYLFGGRIGFSQLSGPVGIYSIVDNQAKEGAEALLYLVAYLSINVGIINLLPFPAFDGGRILFLIIEKVFRKPVSKKVENIIHTIGFILIIGLLIVITIMDVLKLV